MTPEQYDRFTTQLKERLNKDERVLGFVALGSMAEQDYRPDQWSDHDFFVIVQSGTQEFYRNNFEWLPDSSEIIFSFRETPHGVKVLYSNGHLLEFAVFDLDELHLARINRYRILLNRTNLEMHLQQIRRETKEQTTAPDAPWLFGQFLTNLLVGVARYRRGEKLSGHFFVKQSALKHLILLFPIYKDTVKKELLDDLDPMRRFEFVYPEAGAELNRILLLETPQAAKEMLQFAVATFKQAIPNFPTRAVEVMTADFSRHWKSEALASESGSKNDFGKPHKL